MSTTEFPSLAPVSSNGGGVPFQEMSDEDLEAAAALSLDDYVQDQIDRANAPTGKGGKKSRKGQVVLRWG